MDNVEQGAVIVTGAARGIGRSLAFGLLEAGYCVTLMDRAAEMLAATAIDAHAIAPSDRILAVAGDVSRDEDAQRTILDTQKAFGRLDALVNNAGVPRSSIRPDVMRNPYRIWELTPEQWRSFFDSHVHGFFLMTRAVMPHLLTQKSGRVVTITTSLDHMIRAGSSGYGSAKAAMEASMSILAQELAGTGVTANVLVPGGAVNTPAVIDDGAIPRSAFIQAEVMVPPLLWLLSPAAAAVNCQRFIAARWKPSDDPDEAAKVAGAPTAWPQLGTQSVVP